MTGKLVDWFLCNRRELPFRNSSNPYYILVSETMAQQTRMAALIPYFERFIDSFPTVASLAEADEAEVLSLWAGLGYYSRARNLHKAAREICARHNGAVPDSEKTLRALPGVGEYTAGAVASIAFNLPCPAVDGNVRRVYARLFASDGGDVAGWVRSLMEDAPPRLVTESLMELGALICTPSAPKCGQCPVSEVCRAFLEGKVTQFPAKKQKPVKREKHRIVCVARDEKARVLLRRRTERLLHNMWEFPTEERLLADGFAVTRESGPLGTAKHVFTHIVWHMTAYEASVTYDRLPEHYQWAASPRGFALPSAMRAWICLIFAEK